MDTYLKCLINLSNGEEDEVRRGQKKSYKNNSEGRGRVLGM
jgi:hypothetical protein